MEASLYDMLTLETLYPFAVTRAKISAKIMLHVTMFKSPANYGFHELFLR